MALYLNMDGVDDRLQLPSMTFTEIILEMSAIRATNAVKLYVDARTGVGFCYLQSNTNGTDSWSSFNNVYVNGVNQSNNTAMIPNDQRCAVRLVRAAGTDDLTIFAQNSGSANTYVQGKLYNVKIYNGTTLQAHYDMTAGNVNDISGNGRHATLYGGTWLDDGTGGSTGSAYTVSLSDGLGMSEVTTKRYSAFKSLVDSIPLSETISKRLSVAILDTVATSEVGSEKSSKALSDSVSIYDQVEQQGGNKTNLNDVITISDTIRKALVKFQSDAVSTADVDSATTIKSLFDGITQSDSVLATKGKTVVLSDGITLSDSIRKAIGQLRTESVLTTESFVKQSTVNLRLYDVIVSTDDLRAYNPDLPEYSEIIRLPLEIETGKTVVLTIVQREKAKLEIAQRLKLNLDM
jgi:hypothetical protein